jgi:hypothetical protein
MKRSRVYILAISILLVVLVVSGCVAPKAEPCPTTVPQSCPTTAAISCPTTAPLSCPTSVPQSCPTTAAQAMPQMTGWRQLISSYSNVVITFDKGDKCSMEVKNPLSAPEMNLEIVVNDTTYQNYMVVDMILDPGKTLADLETWTSVVGPPTYSQGVGLDIVGPASRTAIGRNIPILGQLYFTCFVQGPDSLKIIGSVGPVEVLAEAP